jgi:hypothetical protein
MNGNQPKMPEETPSGREKRVGQEWKAEGEVELGEEDGNVEGRNLLSDLKGNILAQLSPCNSDTRTTSPILTPRPTQIASLALDEDPSPPPITLPQEDNPLGP